jgi:selenocysteine-specific elongation factor
MEVIVGTAGHIDHGKTALVKALTGVDADRLPEEKRRGITVDLGFADMTAGGMHVGFVDVPGHERFVKNMLAGASGIDIVLLVIEAGEGVMPQTREHFEICRLLGIKNGIIALTKKDLVDAETLDLAKLDVVELVAGSFLERAPVVAVSSRTGEGIEELRDKIVLISHSLPARDDSLITRLPIDRSFSVKGFGAVVTGTLVSGKLNEGTELELLPAGKPVRVRGLQTHGNTVKTAVAGQRVAVNLGGIDHSRISRGMTLSEPGVLRPVQIFDAEIEALPTAPRPLRSRQRVRVHLGTVEALGRLDILNRNNEIRPGDKDFAQVRLESVAAIVPGERFILRSYSPQTTIAGGAVIDPAADKHRKRDLQAVRQRLGDLNQALGSPTSSVQLLIANAGPAGLSFSDLRARTALSRDVLERAIAAAVSSEKIIDAGGVYIAASEISGLSNAVENTLDAFHRQAPLSRGMPREALKESVFANIPDEIFQHVVSSLQAAGIVAADKETIRRVSHAATLTPDESKVLQNLRRTFTASGLEVPRLEDALTDAVSDTPFKAVDARRYFQLLIDSGEVVKVTDEFYFGRQAIDGLVDILRKFAATSPDRLIDVPKFKELAGVSRKYAIPLLEYFDREHVTARAGDKRLIL